MIGDDGLVVSRFVHFAALLFVFGVAFFPIYSYSNNAPAAFHVKSRLKAGLMLASLLALASGLSWLVFTAASMADSLSDAISFSTLTAVLGESGFGRMWAIHLALLTALCVLTVLGRWRRQPLVILTVAFSGACLASLALTGHTQEQEGLSYLVRVGADGAHLLAAGAWLGGLVALLAVLTSRAMVAGNSESEMSQLLTRFSGMGYGAVAILVGTGLTTPGTWCRLCPNLALRCTASSSS